MSHEVTPGGLPREAGIQGVDEEVKKRACLPLVPLGPASASQGSSPGFHSQGPGDHVQWSGRPGPAGLGTATSADLL